MSTVRPFALFVQDDIYIAMATPPDPLGALVAVCKEELVQLCQTEKQKKSRAKLTQEWWERGRRRW